MLAALPVIQLVVAASDTTAPLVKKTVPELQAGAGPEGGCLTTSRYRSSFLDRADAYLLGSSISRAQSGQFGLQEIRFSPATPSMGWSLTSIGLYDEILEKGRGNVNLSMEQLRGFPILAILPPAPKKCERKNVAAERAQPPHFFSREGWGWLA